MASPVASSSSSRRSSIVSTPPPPASSAYALDHLFGLLLHNGFARQVQKVIRRCSPILESSALLLICLLAVLVRQFAVIRYESVIHEFDPYFNFRTTRYLTREGFLEFWNWFDGNSWYPLGRVIGQTLFPGLMTTSALLYSTLHSFGLVIDIRDVCVFLAPCFSAMSAIAAYLFAKEIAAEYPAAQLAQCKRSSTNKYATSLLSSPGSGAGLLAALFMGLSPAYISRSVAGSYDNEAVAIFALILSFYAFVKAVKSGTLLASLLSALAFFYMVLSWGGYVFVLNTIAIYIAALGLLGKLTLSHHLAYTTFYILSTLLCLNIPFVNFGAVVSSEHMASHGIFLLLNALVLVRYVRSALPRQTVRALLHLVLIFVGSAFLILFLWLSITGRTAWSGRSMTLLDPTYATKYIPIIASVSEHQPTTWSAYLFDLHICSLLSPVGLWVCFKRATDGLFFAGIYGILAVYFSGVMIRLMLVLAPAACILSGVGLSFVLSTFVGYIRLPTAYARALLKGVKKRGVGPESSAVSTSVAVFVLGILLWITNLYVNHATWVSSLAYSHPSIILSHKMRDGSRLIQDDFREAYYWFRQNTHPTARLMSWWDYGYQVTFMGNRTVLVDNNTWNNTHIATVGLAFASREEESYPILQKMDVDYVFVVFGGYARYPSDDINKFLWMVRIASGVYPQIQQSSYLSANGMYTVGKDASQNLLESLMYKLCYYRFADATRGFDYARNYEIGQKDISLKHLEEAYTTQNWIVRIYKVKSLPNRGNKVKSRYALPGE
eukprot:GHVS01089260.1.p1 GENE.GHVS01089260.1~~GHVS01089260.1.p1  ORF type:complete len:806 (+),score=77.15 GHVS01089260.1:85-2418(+)